MIDLERFIDWAERRFDTMRVKGNEVKLNSIFTEDTKHKMWCNVEGGKKGQPPCFHCWKTGRKGSLVSLVMTVDKCSYEDALATLGIDEINMGEINAKLEKIFEEKKVVEEKTLTQKLDGFQLPPHTYAITDLPEEHICRITAEAHLWSRTLTIDGLYVCVEDSPPTFKGYKNRIVIPYYDSNNKLIYYNCRTLYDKTPMGKYMGPPLGTPVLKGDVIYMPHWPAAGERVYFTEGEFDALSITVAGLHSGAFGGKAISDTQISYMKNYNVVLSLDNDTAGHNALPVVGNFLLSRGVTKFSYIFPPKPFKDWNEMLCKYGKNILAAYLEKNQKPYHSDYALDRKIGSI